MQDIYNFIPERNHFAGYTTVLQLFCIYNLCYM